MEAARPALAERAEGRAQDARQVDHEDRPHSGVLVQVHGVGPAPDFGLELRDGQIAVGRRHVRHPVGPAGAVRAELIGRGRGLVPLAAHERVTEPDDPAVERRRDAGLAVVLHDRDDAQRLPHVRVLGQVGQRRVRRRREGQRRRSQHCGYSDDHRGDEAEPAQPTPDVRAGTASDESCGRHGNPLAPMRVHPQRAQPERTNEPHAAKRKKFAPPAIPHRSIGTLVACAPISSSPASRPTGHDRRRRFRANGRWLPRRAAGALLPDARLVHRRRGPRAGDAAAGVARPRVVRGTRVDPIMALPDRYQCLPRHRAHPPRAGRPRRRCRGSAAVGDPVAAALPGPPSGRGRARRPRRGARDDRARLPGGHPAPAGKPASRADPARRPRLLSRGNRRAARHQRLVGDQCPATRSGHVEAAPLGSTGNPRPSQRRKSASCCSATWTLTPAPTATPWWR